MSYNQQHQQQQFPYNPNWAPPTAVLAPDQTMWDQQQQQHAVDAGIPPAPTHKPPPPMKVIKERKNFILSVKSFMILHLKLCIQALFQSFITHYALV